MPQHDMDLINQTGADFRADLNVALKALAGNSTGDSTPSTTYAFQFWANTALGILYIRNAANNAWIEVFRVIGNETIPSIYNGSANAPSVRFQDDQNTGIFSRVDDEFNISTGGTERFRITSDGFTKATNTGTVHSNTNFHESFTTNNNQSMHVFSHHGSTADQQRGILVRTLNTNETGTGTADQILVQTGSDNRTQFVVRKNGAVESRTNSFGALSDVKLKENIVDANSQWNDIKAVQVRNFNFKNNKSIKLLGVVAQEIESVSAGLVADIPDKDPTTNEDLGTVTKTVKYSVLYMKAIKALQEAMARIETLETKVATLEGS